MASSLKCFACFFIISLFSTQIHARESQFFSKVSATTPTTTTTTTTVNNKDGVLNKNNEQDPSFIPETQNAYGLYGQESTQYHTTTTKLSSADPYTPTTTIPYKTQDTYSNNNKNGNYYYHNNEYNNVNAYEDQQQNMQMGETRLQDTGYTTTAGATSSNLNNNKNNYYNNYNNGVNGYNNVEKQGMSDTRFLENGRYYHDLNNENNNFYTNQYQNTKVNYDNTRGGYYSNNNENTYEYNNMERSQNMEDFQNEQYDP